MHLLADYITVAAAPTVPAVTDSGASVDSRNIGLQAMEPLAGLRQAAALRQGALALYGACSPAEVTAAAAAAAACSTPCHAFQTRQVAYQFILEIKTEQLPACLASVGTARFCSRPGISGGRWQHVLAGIALTCACLLWVRHSTAQHSTAQHSTAQHSTAQHSTAFSCACCCIGLGCLLQ